MVHYINLRIKFIKVFKKLKKSDQYYIDLTKQNTTHKKFKFVFLK